MRRNLICLSSPRFPVTYQTEPDALPPCLKVEEAAVWLGIGRDHAYALIRKGEFPHVRLGARIVVPRDRLLAFVEGRDA